jgi:hypothetical protein
MTETMHAFYKKYRGIMIVELIFPFLFEIFISYFNEHDAREIIYI